MNTTIVILSFMMIRLDGEDEVDEDDERDDDDDGMNSDENGWA